MKINKLIKDINKRVKEKRVIDTKDKEIKRLKEDYMMLQNASDEVEEEKDKEIERLNDIIEKDKVLIKEANDRAYSEFEENVKLGNENSSLRFENRKLHSIIKEVRNQLYYLETYSSKEDVFEDMKRRLDRIDKIIGSEKE